MTRYQFLLKLAFLGGALSMMVTMAVLVLCGHNGAITNTLLGVSAAFSGANLWQVMNGVKND